MFDIYKVNGGEQDRYMNPLLLTLRLENVTEPATAFVYRVEKEGMSYKTL